MKKAFFLSVTLQFLFLCSYSQILNIESYRLEKDTSNVFLGNIGAGFNTKKQAISTINRYNSNINAAYLSQNNAYLLLSTLALVQVANQQVQNEGYIHFRINFLRKKKYSPELFSQLQYDRGRGLEKRELVGLTCRARIFYNKNWSISGNSGLMLENENWNFNAEIKNTEFIKSTSNITIKSKLTPTINWYLITYYQARLQYFLQPRLTLDTYFQFKISSKFNFNMQYVATYDEKPVISIPNLIYSLNSIIQYNF